MPVWEHKVSTISSAGAVELRNEIARLSGMSLPGTLVFDYPTISAIAGFLLSKQPAAVLETIAPQAQVTLRYDLGRLK